MRACRNGECRLGDQVVSGVAINFIASGLTATIASATFQQGGRTEPLSSDERFMPLALPFQEQIGAVPVIGEFYTIVVGSQDIFFYLMIVAVFVAGVVLDKTDFGLTLRAAGDNPEVVDAAGRSVSRIRYGALAITGAALRRRRPMHFDGPDVFVSAGNDSRSRILGTYGADLRPMAPGTGPRGLSAFWLPVEP